MNDTKTTVEIGFGKKIEILPCVVVQWGDPFCLVKIGSEVEVSKVHRSRISTAS